MKSIILGFGMLIFSSVSFADMEECIVNKYEFKLTDNSPLECENFQLAGQQEFHDCKIYRKLVHIDNQNKKTEKFVFMHDDGSFLAHEMKIDYNTGEVHEQAITIDKGWHQFDFLYTRETRDGQIIDKLKCGGEISF